jgi:hypothetical protein
MTLSKAAKAAKDAEKAAKAAANAKATVANDEAPVNPLEGYVKMNDEVKVVDEAVTTQYDAAAEAEAIVKTKGKEKAKKDVEEVEVRNGLSYPKRGTQSRSIWDLCEKLNDTEGGATRKAVVTQAVALGTNKATASTQYARWKKFVGPC